MKKILIFSKIILAAGVLLCTMNSCKKEPKQEDPKEVAEDQNDAKFESDDAEDDADYLLDAAEINLSEIEIGKLAQAKGVSQGVKDFGKKLIEDHTKSLDELKALANKKAITLPTTITEDGKEKYNKLNEKSGTEFDKKFAELMVEGHEKAIDKITKISNKAKEHDIQLWATSQLTALKMHLDHAKKLKTDVKK